MSRRRAALAVAALAVLAAGLWALRSTRSPARAARAPQPAPRAELDADPALARRAIGPPGDAAPPAGGSAAASERLAALAANREGLARLEAGDLAGAVERFEASVAAAPAEPVLRGNLAEGLARLALSERDGDGAARERALALLERAAGLAPDRSDLATLLERWRRGSELERAFWTDRSEHFELAFDGGRDELLHGTAPLLEALERTYLELGERFGVFPVEEGRAPIRVELHERADFGELTGLGDWAGGAFDGTVRVPIEDLAREEPELRRVLRHELVHAFVHAVGGAAVPGWLNEGLAQWFEDEDPVRRAARLEAAREALRDGPPFALERLQGGLATWRDAAAIERAYAQSLALVARIEHDQGERLLVSMVRGCGAGVPPERRFEEVVGVELGSLLVDLAEPR